MTPFYLDVPHSNPVHVWYIIFIYIYHENQPNAGKYPIHGSYGYGKISSPRLVLRVSCPSTWHDGQGSGFYQTKSYISNRHDGYYMGGSKNRGNPKSSILIGFSIIFTIHFG